jgi:NADH-quinone oxidoreductase subunit E
MKRYDLRHLKDDFYDRMAELIEKGLQVDEVGIFLFEVGDFSHIQKSADFVRASGHELMNSLKFNEVDWTIVVKKISEEARKAKVEALALAKEEAEKAAQEAAKIAEEKAAQKAKKLAEKEAAKNAKKAE